MLRSCLLILACLTFPLAAQVTYPVNGVTDQRNITYAFIHATITTEPGKVIDDAILVVRNGKIVEVGRDAAVPPQAVVTDLSGYHIYPSFIELVSDNGVPDKPKQERDDNPQFITKDERAVSWNEAVSPEFDAASALYTDTAANRKLREAGFGAALVHRPDGIVRGTGSVVLLGSGRANENMLLDIASMHFSFRKGSSRQNYPSSQMGAIALLRQTMYDMEWYVKGGKDLEYNLSLEALGKQKELPFYMHVGDKLEVLRASSWAKEFDKKLVIEEDGTAYQRAEAIAGTGHSLIVPVDFPDAYDVSDPLHARTVKLSDMKHWELAPANAAILQEHGVDFALTSNGLKKRNSFPAQVGKAIRYGLSDSLALAACTTIPARLAGVSDQVGKLTPGMTANFLVTSGPVFDADATLHENWVDGKPYIITPRPAAELRGAWELRVDNSVIGLLVTGNEKKLKYQIVKESDTIKAKGESEGMGLHLTFTLDSTLYRLNGIVEGRSMSGTGTADSRTVRWEATFGNVYAEKEKTSTSDTLQIGKVVFPFTAYGGEELPVSGRYLITHATVWTNEKEGILTDTDVLVAGGKILKVGKGLSDKEAIVIDATGKHLTTGIIDEHSHIAISRGVNEGTQAVTSEVRIGDVINSDDVNIYRQLAGGVTTSHLLHGSANPIGGQTALIKLRWGSTPEQMKFEDADGFIKFALGENVKQSNWGDDNRVRFPQTRMGVEQVMADAFTRALAYEAAMNRKDTLVRRDLELDALLEILRSERFITCHSYVQSEINMLMKLAERFGFTLNTFTHILEGYKVADKMVAHGAGGSTFSDWWAYKYEVREAIPYNAALMAKAGVVTAINSDDAEMARRLNQEAAKAVKYGNLSEEEAWKLVTLNPAKLLHIDDRVGSISKGKDADLVIWSDHPMSIYSRAEKTFVDGILYFDLEQDEARRQAMAVERDRLVKAMLKAAENGADTQVIVIREEPEYECDTMFDFTTE